MPLPSLYIGAQGISEQQKAINVVSNNLANVSTVGFKKSTVSFQESVSNVVKQATHGGRSIGATNPQDIGTGVKLSSVNTNFAQGAIKNTGSPLNMALNGQGFFVVSTSAETGGGLTNPFFTRDGNFSLDASGNLVNSAGNKVMGVSFYDDRNNKAKIIDSNYTGVTYWTDQDIQGPGNLAMATPPATTPSGPSTPSIDFDTISEFSIRGNLVDPAVPVDTVAPGDFQITRNEFDNFDITYTEGATTYAFELDPSDPFNDTAVSIDLQDTAGTGNTVQLRLRVKPGIVKAEEIFQGFVYDKITNTGSSLAISGAVAQTSNAITVGADDAPYLSEIDMADLYDPIVIPPLFYTIDNNFESTVSNISISSDGSIAALGSNSEKMILGQVLIANFQNYDGLVNKGNSLFEESPNSGVPSYNVLNGPSEKGAPTLNSRATQVVSGALEQSNVDIAEEFSEMIAFQRGLQASARTVSISDEILQSIINI